MRTSIAITIAVLMSVVLASVASAQTPTPAPPVIPLQWQAGHVSVFWNVNQTAAIEVGGWQYWDYTVPALRQDMAMSGVTFVNLNQYASQTQYQLQVATWAGNAPACVKQALSPADAMADRFLFANGTYSGRQTRDGTAYDVWWVIQNRAGASAMNVTIWWDSAHNLPGSWTSVAVDGSSFTETSLFAFQPNTNTPGGNPFTVPALCTTQSAAAPTAAPTGKTPSAPKLTW